MLRCAAFGVPSESADASLLLAWLARNMAVPAGCVLSIPPDLPQSINDHVIHLLQRLMKVRHSALVSRTSSYFPEHGADLCLFSVYRVLRHCNHVCR